MCGRAGATQDVRLSAAPATLDEELMQRELDVAYQNLLAARTEAGERYWCDRLTYFAGRLRERREGRG